jgi:WD40 repeat protein
MIMRLKFLLVSIGILLQLSLSAQYNFNIKRTYSETNHQIFNANYNTNGKYIVTSGSDNNILIWNAETGIIFKTLAGLEKRPNGAVFNEENNVLVSAGDDNEITIWDPLTSNISTTLTGHRAAINSLSLNPDGNLLASGSDDKTIRIWDIKNKTLIYELKGHKKEVNAVSFSPDGSLLVSAGADKRIIVWNVANGSIVRSEQVHSGWIRDVEFSPDGNMIASCGDDGLIIISKASDLSLINSLKGHKKWVQTIDFSPDGKYLLSGGHDRYIMLWDVASGKRLLQSEKQGQIILSVDFSPVKADFISASLLSENLELWAVSGIDDSFPISLAEKKMSGQQSDTTIKVVEQQVPDEKHEVVEIPDIKPSIPENSVIEILSPAQQDGIINHDKTTIFLIGRVTDPEGTGAIMVNKNWITLSEAGIFECKMNLVKGANPVKLLTVNKMGKMSEMNIIINCSADDASVEAPGVPDIYRSKYCALLIGVNDYQSENIADLDNPINDAENLYNVLSSKYTFDKDNIYLLKNPTQSEIIIKLDELSRELTSDDNLLIFFAGHGYWDKQGNVGFWFPADATRGSTVNWFRNSTLRDFIGSIQTKHTLLIADACFSGAIFKTRAAFEEAPQGIEKLYELQSRQAMTSGILEEVPDESVFIHYLIKRLEENEEEFLPSELLFSSFKTAVMNNSATVPQFGVIQNVGDEGGDFVFIKR